MTEFAEDAIQEMAKTLAIALQSYNSYCEKTKKNDPVSGDHFSGTAFIFFKGTKGDVDAIRKFMKMNEITKIYHLYEESEKGLLE